MRKLTCTIFFSMAASLCAFADGVIVRMGGEKTQEAVNLGYCNLILNIIHVDDDDNATLTIEIENTGDADYIALFKDAYTEKMLREWKIRYDKTFGGSAGRRTVDPSEVYWSNQVLGPSDKARLSDFAVASGYSKNLRLPVYLARYRGRVFRKLCLIEERIIEMEVEVVIPPEPDYLARSWETDNLIRSLAGKTFCGNPAHSPSLAEQERPYTEALAGLKAQVDSLIKSRDLRPETRRGKAYLDLRHRLDSIRLADYEKDCGRHRAPAVHKCKYCSYSLQQIYHKMDDHYKTLYTSEDRAAAKKSVMDDVNLLYKCCTDPRCRNHAAQWKRGGEYRDKITDRYSRIRSL